MPVSRAEQSYSPLYFLASVGAGGLSVTFFMYLMFWVPHPGQPVPVFEDILGAFQTGSLGLKSAIAIALVGILGFAIMNLKLLFWNLSRLRRFSRTEAYGKLVGSNAETQLLAMPLALAMSVNAAFTLGLVFVPGLWGVVEYLFPLALVAFTLIAAIAFHRIGRFLGRVLARGGVFDMTAHNSFAQLLPAFALIMSAVGLAAPAAMSANQATVGVSLVLSTIVGTAAMIYAVVAAITAFASMLHYGTARESGPTLMIIVPLMTIFGIMTLRQNHGLHTSFDTHGTAADTLVFLTTLIAVQLIFAALGLLVMRTQKYFDSFVFGSDTSPGSYALVCPGVALSVLLQFWINKGLVETTLIAKFSAGYWTLTAIAIAFQVLMIALVFRLNRQHFGRPQEPVAVPAE